MTDDLLYHVADGCATLTLNRPDKRNALSLPLQARLAQALWEADNDTAVRCVILRGAGPSFCAGYDLSKYQDEVLPSPFGAPDSVYRGFRSLDDDAWQQEQAQRYRMALFDMHKPVIAQVQGHCLGGGTDLALLCDMIIAADDAVFAFPPARDLGSLPQQMWLYNVGPQWAKRLLLSGDSINGSEAQQIGLVLKSVPAQHLEQEVQQLAQRLASIDADLLSANKRAVNLALELMGARTLQRLCAEIDARAHNAKAAGDYRRSVKENGLKATLRQRDAQFGDGRARVNGPELRDTAGRLLPDSTFDHVLPTSYGDCSMIPDHAPQRAPSLLLADRFFSAIERCATDELRAIYASDVLIWHNFDPLTARFDRSLSQSLDDNLALLKALPELILDAHYDLWHEAATDKGFVRQHIVRGKTRDGEEVAIPACVVAEVVGGHITRLDEYLNVGHLPASVIAYFSQPR